MSPTHSQSLNALVAERRPTNSAAARHICQDHRTRDAPRMRSPIFRPNSLEAFPEDRAPQYLILDRDSKFKGEVATMLECLGSELIRTGYRSPWQNGVAERWVGSCRRELLDHMIVLNESHLRRRVRDYLEYYPDDRIHDALQKETPGLRRVERRPRGTAKVGSAPRVGGLRHRYHGQAAA
jgi:putative transposase